MYRFKTPGILQKLQPHILWKVNTQQKDLFLTFDDGPTPHVTDWVLDLLEKYNAKATFFCVGENVRKYPQLFEKLKLNGHATGNHTFSHLNGWKTKTEDYMKDIEKFSTISHSHLFRPPYGRISLRQVKEVGRKYKIVMWSMLSGDFDRKLDIRKSIERLKKGAGKGSIIVFHDSLKAEQNLRKILPPLMDHFSRQGYSFNTL
jgi:peptidoglycan/xylan/chitin deacetylase (PgdA/CDA1 family)